MRALITIVGGKLKKKRNQPEKRARKSLKSWEYMRCKKEHTYRAAEEKKSSLSCWKWQRSKHACGKKKPDVILKVMYSSKSSGTCRRCTVSAWGEKESSGFRAIQMCLRREKMRYYRIKSDTTHRSCKLQRLRRRKSNIWVAKCVDENTRHESENMVRGTAKNQNLATGLRGMRGVYAGTRVWFAGTRKIKFSIQERQEI